MIFLFCLLLNSDAVLTANLLTHIRAAARAHPHASFIASRSKGHDGAAQTSCFRFPGPMRKFLRGANSGPKLITSLERLTADPDAEQHRIGRPLRFPVPLVWQSELPAQNVSADRGHKFPMHHVLVTNPVATAFRRILVPRAVRQRIRDARKKNERPELPKMMVDRLRGVFAADLPELNTLFFDVQLGFERRILDSEAVAG